MKMKLQNQKMLSLFLVALIVFVGVGQSLLDRKHNSNVGSGRRNIQG